MHWFYRAQDTCLLVDEEVVRRKTREIAKKVEKADETAFKAAHTAWEAAGEVRLVNTNSRFIMRLTEMSKKGNPVGAGEGRHQEPLNVCVAVAAGGPRARRPEAPRWTTSMSSSPDRSDLTKRSVYSRHMTCVFVPSGGC